jgi:hypothetical protein
MSSKAGSWSAAVALVVLLAVPALAVAAGFTPTLGAPDKEHVHTGTITIKVHAPDAKSVYVAIRPTRKVSNGQLKSCVLTEKGCEYYLLKPWTHHPGWWKLTAKPAGYSGWWTTTPGKYYWQAESFAKTPPCSLASGPCYFFSTVGSFRVVG